MPLKYINHPIIRDCVRECCKNIFNNAELHKYLPKEFYDYIITRFYEKLEKNRDGNDTTADSMTRVYDLILNHANTFNVWNKFMSPYLINSGYDKNSIILFWDQHIKRRAPNHWLPITQQLWKKGGQAPSPSKSIVPRSASNDDQIKVKRRRQTSTINSDRLAIASPQPMLSLLPPTSPSRPQSSTAREKKPTTLSALYDQTTSELLPEDYTDVEMSSPQPATPRLMITDGRVGS